jgi:hypothetical protein
MAKKTPEEIYEYVLGYKNDLKDSYNAEQEKHFSKSNALKIQLSNQLIVFSSLLLSVGSGYLLSSHTPNAIAQNLLVVAIFTLATSVGFGLYNTHSASEYYLKWAKNAHDKGGMVYHDNSKTVEELEVLIIKLGDKNASVPISSNKFPFIGQTLLFTIAVILILCAMCFVVYG